MRHSSHLLATALFGAIAAMAATPAAAITCDGNIQVQRSGERIITPFCQDNHLSEVAREYGNRTSAYDIRWNPSVKASLCRLVGEDNRVRDTCAPYIRNDRNDFWR